MEYSLFQSLYTETLGLKKIREKYGYSRAAFSRLSGVPVRTMEDWDAGRRKMPDYFKSLICYALFEGGEDGK